MPHLFYVFFIGVNKIFHKINGKSDKITNFADKQNSMMEATTVFTPIQLQLLQLFSHENSESELFEIKKILSKYFSKKVEEGMSELWEKGLWSKEKNELILKTHLRTPYGGK